MVKFFLLFISMFLTACVAPTPKKNASKRSNQMVYLEKLDTVDANKRILEYRKMEEEKFPDIQFMGPATDCRYSDSMGYVVYIGKDDDGYLKMKRRKESLFGEYRYYFLNGNLKESGEYYFQDFHCGIWKEYDEKGNLLKETDMDKPYQKYSWQNILAFAKKRNINLYDDQTTVDRYVDESNIPHWYITWKDKTEVYFHLVTIDARNGDVIEDDIAYGKK